MRRSLVVFWLLAVGACSAPTPVCAPGKSERCVGVGGCIGGQVCNGEGTGFGPCACGLPPAPDAGPDGGPLVEGDAGTADAGAPLTVTLGPVFSALTLDAGAALRAYDFEVTSVADHFVLAFVGSGALYTRPISSAGVAGLSSMLGTVGATYASNVSAAKRDALRTAVVASGADGQLLHQLDPNGSAGGVRLAGTLSLPSFNAIAWAGDVALIAWTTGGTVSLQRVRRDGGLVDLTPMGFSFPASTFVPHVAVASDGVDWMVALSATQTLVFRVTSTGPTQAMTLGSGEPGGTLSLAHGPHGYLLVAGGSVTLLSPLGAVLAGPRALPTLPGPPSIEVTSLARDEKHFLLVRTRSDLVAGLLLDDDGVPAAPPFDLDTTSRNGERCSVTSLTSGTWLVAWGTRSNDAIESWFSTVSARVVTVTP